MFGAQPPIVNVFGAKKQGLSNLFNTNMTQPAAANLFGPKDEGKTEKVVNLFDKSAQPAQNPLFSSKSDSAPSLFPGVTSVFAANPPPAQPAPTDSKIKPSPESLIASNTSSKGLFNVDVANKVQTKSGEDTKTMFSSFFGPPQDIKPATITSSQKESAIQK